MFRIKSRVEFDAAHFLLGTDTPCDVLHGHRWAVDVTLKSETLTPEGFVMNFTTLKAWMKEMTENLDHNLLNFYLRQTTAENLACAFYLFMTEKLKPYNRAKRMNVAVERIDIAETPNNAATYSLEDFDTRAEKIRRAAILQWENPEKRKTITAALRKANEDPALRKARSIRMFKNNPMQKRDVVGKMLASLMKSKKVTPNAGEQEVADWLAENNVDMKFCGDGSFILDGKIPDFVNHAARVVLEYNGRFWHSRNKWNDAYDDSKERVAFFAERGYKCVIVWDDEFKDAGKRAKLLATLRKMGV